MKGKKDFKFPEEIGMSEGSKQEADQIKRLISNKQITTQEAQRIYGR